MVDGSEKNAANAQDAKGQGAGEAKQAGKLAIADYEAAAAAIRAKTEKLRALRLARDAANPPAPAKKRKAAGKKGASSNQASGNLADWLDEQAKQGRRS